MTRSDVRDGSNASIPQCPSHVRFALNSDHKPDMSAGRFGADFVAKLGGRRLARNNRIGGKQFLSRCCALIAVLESMLPARALKIVLQQNRHRTDLPACPVYGRYWGQSGRGSDMAES